MFYICFHSSHWFIYNEWQQFAWNFNKVICLLYNKTTIYSVFYIIFNYMLTLVDTFAILIFVRPPFSWQTIISNLSLCGRYSWCLPLTPFQTLWLSPRGFFFYTLLRFIKNRIIVFVHRLDMYWGIISKTIFNSAFARHIYLCRTPNVINEPTWAAWKNT